MTEIPPPPKEGKEGKMTPHAWTFPGNGLIVHTVSFPVELHGRADVYVGRALSCYDVGDKADRIHVTIVYVAPDVSDGEVVTIAVEDFLKF